MRLVPVLLTDLFRAATRVLNLNSATQSKSWLSATSSTVIQTRLASGAGVGGAGPAREPAAPLRPLKAKNLLLLLHLPRGTDLVPNEPF